MIKSMKQRRRFLSDKEKSVQSRNINKNSFSNEAKMNKQCGVGGGSTIGLCGKSSPPTILLKIMKREELKTRVFAHL